MTGAAFTYDPTVFQRVFVEDAHHLAEVVGELQSADAIGVDLEMVQRVHRRPGGYQEWVQVLALIQIASDTLSVVVDPVRCRDLSPLRPLMAGGPRKVFLGGGQDATLLEGAGIPARGVVDVGEVALAVFGRREDGMAALSRRIFGISLDKTVRRADWLARPINPVLLAYAHRDAELTLLIYRWFQERYPELVSLHERDELEPVLPPSAPEWLRAAVGRPSSDAVGIVMEFGINPEHDVQRLSDDLRPWLQQSRAPRQMNRLLRVAGELGLKPLLPDVLPFAESGSSLVRAAAARAIGQLAEPEVGEPLLERLRQDPLEDVKKAAEAGLRDLRTPKVAVTDAEQEDEAPSLAEGALSALQRLKEQLQGEAP